MGYDGSLKFDTGLDTGGFNSGIKKIGSIAKAGFAVVATAATSAAIAFGAITKASLDAVASLEQNIGGVETLFKESADVVIQNAKNAYKTAGMSANQYMETVTSFSASLLQSLAGDTKAAADVADMAIKDMSDNANKMGTDMQLIQNAYQGFAKQNYTMLDNLKLGYGGTKKEMERLLADAQKLTGVKYDINNLNDVYQAIHIIQEDLGITGTTAREAASTIEGSMASAKAAYDNFLSGTISAEDFADTIGIAAENITKNLGMIVPRLAKTIPIVVKEIYNMLKAELAGKSSQLIDSGFLMIQNITNGLRDAAPQIADKGAEILENLMLGIQEYGPVILDSAAELISTFAQGISEQLPELTVKAFDMLVALADSIIANIPVILEAGIGVLKGLVQGIILSLPTLISEGPRIINNFASAIYSGLWNLITAGGQMLVSLAKGLWDNRGLILEHAGEIFMAILNIFSLSKLFSLGKGLIDSMGKGMKELLPNIGEIGKSILRKLLDGIKSLATHPVTTLKEIATNAMNAIKNIDWKTVGGNMIDGIKNGIKSAAKKLVEAALGAAKDAVKAVKKWLGIKSPSRRMRDEVGKYMAEGIGVGFEENIPIEDMQKNIDHSIKKIQATINGQVTVGSMKESNAFVGAHSADTESTERKEYVIHTHVNLDGKEVGYAITPYVDSNLAEEEELRERGN